MHVVERAKQTIIGRGLRLVLPEGGDDRIVAAARRLKSEQLAEPIRDRRRRPRTSAASIRASP